MESAGRDYQSYHEALMLHSNGKYEFVTYSNNYQNVEKQQSGNFKIKNDTIFLEYMDQILYYYLNTDNKNQKLYPILSVIDSTGKIVQQNISKGFSKPQLSKKAVRKITKANK